MYVLRIPSSKDSCPVDGGADAEGLAGDASSLIVVTPSFAHSRSDAECRMRLRTDLLFPFRAAAL